MRDFEKDGMLCVVVRTDRGGRMHNSGKDLAFCRAGTFQVPGSNKARTT